MKIEISGAGGVSSPGIRFPRTSFPFAGVGWRLHADHLSRIMTPGKGLENQKMENRCNTLETYPRNNMKTTTCWMPGEFQGS